MSKLYWISECISLLHITSAYHWFIDRKHMTAGVDIGNNREQWSGSEKMNEQAVPSTPKSTSSPMPIMRDYPKIRVFQDIT